MEVHLKLFAVARQLAGSETIALQLDEPADIGAVRRALARAVPALTSLLPHLLFSVDADYAHDGTPVSADSEVACIPPVSGG